MNFCGKEIELDSEGYLIQADEWSESLAQDIAVREGITMTDAHWEVVRFVRQFYMQYNTSPAIRLLVKAISQQYGEEKGNSRYLFRLFPDGPAKQATKIAGLPKPARCL